MACRSSSTTGSTEEGTVEEVLPRQMFRVRLGSGRAVRVGLSTASKHGIVRLIEGDRVIVRVSSVDPSRGQIEKKL